MRRSRSPQFQCHNHINQYYSSCILSRTVVDAISRCSDSKRRNATRNRREWWWRILDQACDSVYRLKNAAIPVDSVDKQATREFASLEAIVGNGIVLVCETDRSTIGRWWTIGRATVHGLVGGNKNRIAGGVSIMNMK